jgi:hypothetical protein
LAIACCFFSAENHAAEKKQTTGTVTIQLSREKGSEIRLEARNAPLAQILFSLQKKTGIQIHYSVLPEGEVTATCVGSTAKPILECLLAAKSDLVFRYPQKTGKETPAGPSEAWILGAKYTTSLTSIVEVCPTQPGASPESTFESDRTDELIAKAKSQNANERASAIGELLGASPDDPAVSAVLEEALTDKDANVRAQAISSYANREGDKAFGALQEALHDSDPWVRQMAVDSANDRVLLQQATNDSEESVRSLALTKLKASKKSK